MKKNIILYLVIGAEALIIAFLLYQYSRLYKSRTVSEVIIKEPEVIVMETRASSEQQTVLHTEAPVTALPEVSSVSQNFSETENADENKSEENILRFIIHDNGNTAVEYPYIDAPLNSYDFTGLETDERKRKMYYENGEKKALFGIDVSQYQGEIDWEAVKNDGVEFVIARAGYRGYETGKLNEDKKFLDYARGSRDAGLKFGVYYYSQAISREEAAEEAEYVIRVLEENEIEPDMPVVYDWEYVQDEDPARTDGLPKEVLNECCDAFCSVIKEKGYETLYYTNITEALFRYDMSRLSGSGYGMWLAEYSASTDFIYDYKMWQYSCSGVINGIESLVDLNLWFE